ncbi:MAG: FAD-dependent oxidoreductase [Pseudomonadota bacterium]
MTIAIIGAGLAGLSAAHELVRQGKSVRLFDKGRGPGGRMSTRRAQTGLGELRWDHGAQYFTARDSRFREVVEDLVATGAAAIWEGRFVSLSTDGEASPLTPEVRFVGAPGMNAIIKALGEGFNVAWGKRVERISGSAGHWTLDFEDGGKEGPFDAVVSAVPAEQVPALLEDVAPDIAKEASSVVSAPCWALMLAFSEPIDSGFDAARRDGGPIAWLARNSSKPGRDDGETWVVHASPDWSRDHLEDTADAVADRLAEAFRHLTGAPEPSYAAAHRWRYSQVETTAATPAIWDASLTLGACGDWRIAPRVEAAWTSGLALAELICNPE